MNLFHDVESLVSEIKKMSAEKMATSLCGLLVDIYLATIVKQSIFNLKA